MVESDEQLATAFVCLSLFAAPSGPAKTAPPEARALIEQQLEEIRPRRAEADYALAAP